jgi:cytochrome c biogenesis protein CcdA
MPPIDRSFSDVIQNIVRNIQDIVRSEMRLAKTELGEEFTKAKSASMVFGFGAVTGIFSVFFILLTAMYALCRLMPDWAAALTIAAGLAIISTITLRVGGRRFATVQGAPKTVKSLEENFQWAKQQRR